VVREASNPPVPVLDKDPLELAEECLIRRGIVKRGTQGIERRDAFLGNQHEDRGSRAVQLLRDPACARPVLVRSRPHQGDLRIVDMEAPGTEPLRDGLHRTKVHHVERAEAQHIRHSRLQDRLEAIGPAGEDAAH